MNDVGTGTMTDAEVEEARHRGRLTAAYHVALVEGGVDAEAAMELTRWYGYSFDPECDCEEIED